MKKYNEEIDDNLKMTTTDEGKAKYKDKPKFYQDLKSLPIELDIMDFMIVRGKHIQKEYNYDKKFLCYVNISLIFLEYCQYTMN